MKLIDIGANLSNEQFNHDVHEVIADAQIHNIEKIYTTTTSEETFFKNISLCDLYNNIFTTWGLHPHNASLLNEFILNTEPYINNPKIKAIGEFGLDYFRMISTKEEQRNAMKYFLEISKKIELPLFMHERDAFEEFIFLFKESNVKNNGVVHCFTGNKTQLKSYLDLNLYIGITGWICDERRNKDLIEAIKYLPNDKLLLETDSPYLKPRNSKQRSQRNEPKNLTYILDKICEIKKLELEEASLIIYNNTLRFFNNETIK